MVIVAPSSKVTEKVTSLVGLEVSIVTRSENKIGSIVQKKTRFQNSESIIYKTPCGTCKKPYFGESGRGFRTRIKEHKADLRHHRLSNAMVIHAERTDHLPDWASASVIHTDFSKFERRAVEAAYIAVEDNINTSPGFFRLATPVAHRIINSIALR